MAYTIATGFAIYFVMWWIVLFLTLPFGVRSQHEDGAGAPGTDPGAPIVSRMGAKLIWTTVISAGIFLMGLFRFYSGYFFGQPVVKVVGQADVFSLFGGCD